MAVNLDEILRSHPFMLRSGVAAASVRPDNALSMPAVTAPVNRIDEYPVGRSTAGVTSVASDGTYTQGSPPAPVAQSPSGLYSAGYGALASSYRPTNTRHTAHGNKWLGASSFNGFGGQLPRAIQGFNFGSGESRR